MTENVPWQGNNLANLTASASIEISLPLMGQWLCVVSEHAFPSSHRDTALPLFMSSTCSWRIFKDIWVFLILFKINYDDCNFSGLCVRNKWEGRRMLKAMGRVRAIAHGNIMHFSKNFYFVFQRRGDWGGGLMMAYSSSKEEWRDSTDFCSLVTVTGPERTAWRCVRGGSGWC